MTNKKIGNIKKGKLAEDIAFRYLLKLNHTVLETNWSVQKAELDIISKQDNTLIFTEVKSRKNNQYGDPSTMVTRRKQKLLVSAASKYMDMINYDGEFRFDIITITGYDLNHSSIEHYENAFFPGLDF